MSDEHICEVCFVPSHTHDGRCVCGCGHFMFPLCCEGCACRSFEEAHATPILAGETT